MESARDAIWNEWRVRGAQGNCFSRNHAQFLGAKRGGHGNTARENALCVTAEREIDPPGIYEPRSSPCRRAVDILITGRPWILQNRGAEFLALISVAARTLAFTHAQCSALSRSTVVNLNTWESSLEEELRTRQDEWDAPRRKPQRIAHGEKESSVA